MAASVLPLECSPHSDPCRPIRRFPLNAHVSALNAATADGCDAAYFLAPSGSLPSPPTSPVFELRHSFQAGTIASSAIALFENATQGIDTTTAPGNSTYPTFDHDPFAADNSFSSVLDEMDWTPFGVGTPANGTTPSTEIISEGQNTFDISQFTLPPFGVPTTGHIDSTKAADYDDQSALDPDFWTAQPLSSHPVTVPELCIAPQQLSVSPHPSSPIPASAILSPISPDLVPDFTTYSTEELLKFLTPPEERSELPSPASTNVSLFPPVPTSLAAAAAVFPSTSTSTPAVEPRRTSRAVNVVVVPPKRKRDVTDREHYDGSGYKAGRKKALTASPSTALPEVEDAPLPTDPEARKKEKNRRHQAETRRRKAEYAEELKGRCEELERGMDILRKQVKALGQVPDA